MINIIIVDDSQEKIDAILNGLPAEIKGKVDIAKSKSSAQKLFANKIYDLAFIDLALPRHDGGVPIPNEGVNLIQEINEFDWFNSPNKILAITQHEALEKDYSDTLKKIGVTLHFYDGTAHLKDIIKYQYDSVAKASKQLEYGFDVLIIAALDEESAPIIEDKRFTWVREEIVGIDDINIRVSDLSVSSKNFKVAIVTLPRMGLVSSAITTSRVVNQIRPRYVFMPGICAGVEGEVELGDIIVANLSWEWQNGKIKGDDFAIEPYQIPVNQIMITRAEQLLKTDILEQLWKDTKQKRPDRVPNYHIGPVVSGSSVISNSNKIEELRAQHRKLIGIEMEIFGVYAACSQSNVRPDFIGFKSVCDFGNESKSDNYHQFCSEICGKLCVDLVVSVLAARN
jgi:nucleoside phosphorylase/CheY-like chemotaxis protein